MQTGLSHYDRVQPIREADVQLINTLRQKNEDLNNEISILKKLLREEEARRGKFSEERDSYKIALQVLTKEFNTAEFNSPSSTHDQPDDNYVEPGKNHGPNSKTNRVKAKNLTARRPRLGRKFNKYQSISQTVSLRLVTRIRIPIKMPVPLITQTSQLCLLATQ